MPHKVVYFVRHAEAKHNIKEREAVQAAIARGVFEKSEQEKARRAVLQDESLRDAPLSSNGTRQVRRACNYLGILNAFSRYPVPEVVLVSPLRRALMTATELYGNASPRPVFVAMEILREKRTGFAADERSSVDVLEREFPHVDFSHVKALATGVDGVPMGEDNMAVRARVRAFLEGPFCVMAQKDDAPVAVVTHKGWLREMRHTLKSWVDEGHLQVDFDLDQWDQTLFGNAEVRVNEFAWTCGSLTSVVSKSVENAIGSAVLEDAIKKQIQDRIKKFDHLLVQ